MSTKQKPSPKKDLPGPGIYNMSREDYDALPYANQSGLKLFKDNPSKYKAEYLEGRERQDTPAMRTGRLLHMAILEPLLFARQVAVLPRKEEFPEALDTAEDLKAKCKELKLKVSGKKQDLIDRILEVDPKVMLWDEHLARLTKGKTMVKPEEFEQFTKMADTIRANKEANKFLQGGQPEMTIIWVDPDYQVMCKAQVDYIRDGWIVDYKTTESAHEENFYYSVRKYGYDIQNAFYTDGLLYATGMETQMLFVAQEKKYPYCVQNFELDFSFVDRGRTLYKDYLKQFKECQESGIWPGYSDCRTLISLNDFDQIPEVEENEDEPGNEDSFANCEDF